MSVAGADRFAGLLWRLPHLAGAERADALETLRHHAGELVALDHLPELAQPYAAFLADPSATEALRAGLLAARARHDEDALRECRVALLRWAVACEADPASARAEAEALAARWPRLARELDDHRALERWLRDGSTEGLRPASELTMRWEDTTHGAPRRFEGRIEAPHEPGVVTLAARWARVLDGAFDVGPAPRTTRWQGPPSERWDRSEAEFGARYGMLSADVAWFDGPGDVQSCWGAFARPLGLGPDAWLLVRTEGRSGAPGTALTVECSAPAEVLARMAERFAARQLDGGP